MLPHIDTIVWLVIIVGLFYAGVSWMSMVFQSLLFQRYRSNRNEAAMREERLHDQELAKTRYRNSLLGEVQGDREE
jgi:hypothetical protein